MVRAKLLGVSVLAVVVVHGAALAGATDDLSDDEVKAGGFWDADLGKFWPRWQAALRSGDDFDQELAQQAIVIAEGKDDCAGGTLDQFQLHDCIKASKKAKVLVRRRLSSRRVVIPVAVETHYDFKRERWEVLLPMATGGHWFTSAPRMCSLFGFVDFCEERKRTIPSYVPMAPEEARSISASFSSRFKAAISARIVGYGKRQTGKQGVSNSDTLFFLYKPLGYQVVDTVTGRELISSGDFKLAARSEEAPAADPAADSATSSTE